MPLVALSTFWGIATTFATWVSSGRRVIRINLIAHRFVLLSVRLAEL